MRKIISLLLAMILILMCVFPATAAPSNNSIISPQYLQIQTASTNLTINQNTGVSTVTATCLVRNDCSVEIICRLQKYGDISWTTVKKWSTSDTFYASLEEYWAVYSGYTYRVYTTYIVRDTAGNFVESTSLTKSVVYPKK